MKVKLKLYIRDTNQLNIPGYQHLTKDKWYEAEFIYISLDQSKAEFIYISLDQSKPHFYRLECDDGTLRKFIPNLFVTAEDWRDSQLQKLI